MRSKGAVVSRKRFVIVDPAQTNPNSHNYEYNKVLARQAAAAGYDVALLINQHDASDFTAIPAQVERVFVHSTYDYDSIHDMWRSRTHRRLNTARSLIAARLSKLPNLTFFQVYPDVAQVLGYLGRALVVLLSPFLHMFNFVFDRVVQRSTPYHRDQFAAVLAQHFTRHPCSAGDRVVIHSATPAMLESLTELRARMNLAAPLPAHGAFIFHHSISEPNASAWYLEYYQFANLKWLRRRWEIASPFRTSSFHALSPQLVAELTAETGLPFVRFKHCLDSSTFKRVLGQDLALVTRSGGAARIGIRASDITYSNCDDILAMIATVRRLEPKVEFKLLTRNLSSQSEEVTRFLGAEPATEFMSTDGDEAYIRALVGIDLLVLPYNPRVYRKRISGVQLECAVVGTAIVAPSRSTLTEPDAPGRVFAFDRPRGMAGAVVRFVKSRSKQDFGTKRAAAVKRDRSVAFRGVIDELSVEGSKGRALTVSRYGPIATVVSPFWGRCGSTTVFDGETEYLLDRNYYVARVMVAQWRLMPHNTKTVFDMVRENSQRVKPHLFLIASRARWRSLASRLLPRFWGKSALGQDAISIGCSTDHDKTLAAYFFDKSELAIVNHSFHGEYLKRFKRAKVVLETQDIQALQYRIRSERNRLTGRAENVEQWIRDEAEIWKGVDACVNLSTDEQSVIGRTAANSHLIRPLVHSRELSPKRAWPEFVRTNSIHEIMISVTSYDFMLWGDIHQANINSSKWFIENIALHPDFAGRKTFICGRLGGVMYQHFANAPGLYFSGFIDDIEEAMLRAKLLVLPDQMGSGISIKTLDTLATGRPFAASRIALRSLELGNSDYRGAKDALEMQKDCKALLADDKARAARGELGRRWHAANISKPVFYDNWDATLRSVGLLPYATSVTAPALVTEVAHTPRYALSPTPSIPSIPPAE
jgi:hypothetical protein